ncbi:MAG TPA: PAS domain-containing protein [Chloroflexota bacterium]
MADNPIYQEIVENALAVTQARLVILTRFDAGSGLVETMAWAGVQHALIERAAARVRRFWPDFEIKHFVGPADANEWLRRGYLAGEAFSAPLAEVATGLVDDRVVRIASSVAGLRHSFHYPLLIEGRVEGAIVLFTAEQPDEAARRICAAFARQAALPLENARLLEQARRTRAELEAVFDATEDALVVIGQDMRILRANRGARALMAELIGRDVETLTEFNRLVQATPPDEQPSPAGVIPRALAGQAGSRLLILAARGQQRRMHVHAAPVRDAGGQIVAAMVVARDLTALHDALVERGRLDGAIKTARLVAHQLNNQLSLLTGYGELLADEGEGDAAEFARGIVRGARASAETIARLQRIIRFEEIDGGADYLMLDLEASTSPAEDEL